MLAGAGGAESQAAPGLAFALAKEAGEDRGTNVRGGDPGSGKSAAENAPEAQPSEKSSVPKSMATMVLDNSALSA
ncbi:MAG: hypothetical protein ACRD25_13595, partial [Terracidiphilus sp.]